MLPMHPNGLDIYVRPTGPDQEPRHPIIEEPQQGHLGHDQGHISTTQCTKSRGCLKEEATTTAAALMTISHIMYRCNMFSG